MRTIIWLAICLFSSIEVTAQSISQEGVVYQYNGKHPRTPLGKVTIIYNSGRQSVVSEEKDGAFTLTLMGLKMGDRIGPVEVKKRDTKKHDMIVFNQQAVDEWTVRSVKLKLILCDKDEFERQKRHLIGIGKREAQKQFEHTKVELEKQLNAKVILQQEYEAKLKEANEKLERMQKDVGKYADLFARIDESEIDTMAQKALELFNQGKVEDAIRKFEDGNYMNKLINAIHINKQASQLKNKSEEAREKATQDSLIALQSLKAQIEAYKLHNDWQKADTLLRGLADILNTVDDNYSYALFCSTQNNLDNAKKYYQRALSLLNSQQDKDSLYCKIKKGTLLTSFADLYQITNQLAESESMYKEALEIRRSLAANSPVYEPGLALSLNNLAGLFFNTRRLNESEVLYKEALGILDRLVAINPQAYENDRATTLNNLANLYSVTQRTTESEMMYKKALEIRRFHMDNNSQNSEGVAELLNNLASLYFKTDSLKKCESLYKEALEIRRNLAKANPQAYESSLAQSLFNLANLYYKTDSLQKCDSLYKEALSIRQSLAKANPQAYSTDVSLTLTNMGVLYASVQQYDKSEKMFKDALEIRRRYSIVNPNVNEPEVASLLTKLANLYSEVIPPRLAESEKMYMEALEIRRHLADFDSQRYEPVVVKSLTNLANLYLDSKRYDESETMYKEALNILRRIAVTTPQVYEPDIARLLTKLAYIYIKVVPQRLRESETMHVEALEIFRSLAKTYSLKYELDVVKSLTNLATLYMDTERYEESEVMFKEELEILRRLSVAIPQVYNPEIADLLTNLGKIYKDSHRLTESIEVYEEALDFYRNLAVFNSLANEEKIANVQYTLAGLYKDNNSLNESKAMYKDALEIFRRLAVMKPQVYELFVAKSLTKLATLFQDTLQMEENELKFKEALEIYRHLSSDTTTLRVHEPQIAWIQGNLGMIKHYQNLYGEAFHLYSEAVSSYEHILAYKPTDKFWNNYRTLLSHLKELYDRFKKEGVPKECEADVERMKYKFNE